MAKKNKIDRYLRVGFREEVILAKTCSVGQLEPLEAYRLRFVSFLAPGENKIKQIDHILEKSRGKFRSTFINHLPIGTFESGERRRRKGEESGCVHENVDLGVC